MPIKDGYCLTDDDFLYYHREDTEWGIWPGELGSLDPGYLVAKLGAIPVTEEEATES